ncbi:MAG: hypothetical protein P8X96_14870 [Desulfobacteraceae bacterium]
MAVIARYKWVALGIVGVFLGLVVWIIFLRYLLARKAIETQADVEKYRLQLELMGNQQHRPQIAGSGAPQLPQPRGTLSDPTQTDEDNRPAH